MPSTIYIKLKVIQIFSQFSYIYNIDALIYLDHTALDMLEFPKNIRVLMFLVDKIVAKDKYAIIAGNKFGKGI